MATLLLRAYADETGDRGSSRKSSPYFSFAVIVVADEDEPELRDAVSLLRDKFCVPPAKVLHWRDHVRSFPRRQFATTTLTAFPRLIIIYVVVEKAAIPPHAKLRDDQVFFYNYAAGLAVERILFAANEWPGGGRRVIVRFGHVKGFNHASTRDYLALKRFTAPTWHPWHRLVGTVHFDDQANWLGLQAADQYAGMLKAAIADFGPFRTAGTVESVHPFRRFRTPA